MGVKIFDSRSLWKVPTSARVARICKFADVDPQKLEDLDVQIHEVNYQKKLHEVKLRETRECFKEMKKELQELESDEEGRDIANIDRRLHELYPVREKLEKEIREGERKNIQVETNNKRAEDITDMLISLNKGRINKPEGIDNIDTSQLEVSLKEIEQENREEHASSIYRD